MESVQSSGGMLLDDEELQLPYSTLKWPSALTSAKSKSKENTVMLLSASLYRHCLQTRRLNNANKTKKSGRLPTQHGDWFYSESLSVYNSPGSAERWPSNWLLDKALNNALHALGTVSAPPTGEETEWDDVRKLP